MNSIVNNLIREFGFWLAIASFAMLTAEKIRPWRAQRALRPELAQDVFWLIFNGYFLGALLGPLFRIIDRGLNAPFIALLGISPADVQILKGVPLWAQVIIVLVVGDFVEWLVHNLLHRVPALWRIHRLHHSIHIMDWIGNFRFHWSEVILYKTVKYLPLAVLGARPEAILIPAVIALFIGYLNHSNLNISWGPLRYVLNSPRMHIWHHDKQIRGRAGVNFAVVFSAWDWLFGTAHMPREARQPERLGFPGDERLPVNLFRRFFLPFLDDGKA